MRKNLFIFNFKDFPTGFLIAILLLVGAEVLARAHSSLFIPLADQLMLYKKDHMMQPQKPYANAVIIGDSRGMGLDARLISGQLSKELQRPFQVYNYTVPGFGVQGYFLFLEKYLKYNRKPETIFLCTRPLMLTGDDFLGKKANYSHKHRFFAFFSMEEYRKVVSPGFFWTSLPLALRERSILITYRASIKAVLVRVLLGQYKPPKADQEALIESMNGGYPLEGVRLVGDKDIQQSLAGQEGFKLDQDALYWYEKFLQLAQNNGVPVVVFNLPFIVDVFAKGQRDGSNDRYRALMRAIKKHYAHLRLVEPLLESYDRKYYADVDHLNVAGNNLAMRGLPQRLAQVLLENK